MLVQQSQLIFLLAICFDCFSLWNVASHCGLGMCNLVKNSSYFPDHHQLHLCYLVLENVRFFLFHFSPFLTCVWSAQHMHFGLGTKIQCLPTYSVYIKRKICKENYSYEDTPLIKIIHLNKAPN